MAKRTKQREWLAEVEVKIRGTIVVKADSAKEAWDDYSAQLCGVTNGFLMSAEVLDIEVIGDIQPNE